jgi:DNA-binding transcriptional LysR family regulator
VEVHVDQSPDLIGRAASGHLDLALSWIEPPAPMLGRRIAELAASWIAAPGDCEVSFSASNPVRLVTANAPCAIRAAAIATLDQAHIPWQIAVATPQLAGVWSAVGAGMGITLRPTLGMPPTLITIKLGQGLPPPPRLPLYLIRGEAEQVKAVRALTAIMTAAIESLTVTSEL